MPLALDAQAVPRYTRVDGSYSQQPVVERLMSDLGPASSTANPESGAGTSPAPPEAVRPPRPRRRGFGEDFQRFFLRGLGTLLPTIITIAVIWYIISFLWESIGWYLIELIKRVWVLLVQHNLVDPRNGTYIREYWQEDQWYTKVVGVALALLAIYMVGLLVGNFIGRAFYRLAEQLVMRVPVVRALYPAVKQVTDFLLNDREVQFAGSRVVAVQPHEKGIWSIALVTGSGLPPLTEKTAEQMVTVFVPSSPTAFSGYVMIAPRSGIVELPMSVEEAMRLLVSGGVIVPGPGKVGKGAKAGKAARENVKGKTAAVEAARDVSVSTDVVEGLPHEQVRV